MLIFKNSYLLFQTFPMKTAFGSVIRRSKTLRKGNFQKILFPEKILKFSQRSLRFFKNCNVSERRRTTTFAITYILRRVSQIVKRMNVSTLKTKEIKKVVPENVIFDLANFQQLMSQLPNICGKTVFIYQQVQNCKKSEFLEQFLFRKNTRFFLGSPLQIFSIFQRLCRNQESCLVYVSRWVLRITKWTTCVYFVLRTKSCLQSLCLFLVLILLANINTANCSCILDRHVGEILYHTSSAFKVIF